MEHNPFSSLKLQPLEFSHLSHGPCVSSSSASRRREGRAREETSARSQVGRRE